MRWLALLIALALPVLANAAHLTAAHTLHAGTIISSTDLALSDGRGAGLSDPGQVIGMQTRVTIYEGRAIPASALQEPRLIERNQIARITYRKGRLTLQTEGRAMAPGAAGDVIRVMNTASRNTISARVNPDGSLSALN